MIGAAGRSHVVGGVAGEVEDQASSTSVSMSRTSHSSSIQSWRFTVPDLAPEPGAAGKPWPASVGRSSPAGRAGRPRCRRRAPRRRRRAPRRGPGRPSSRCSGSPCWRSRSGRTRVEPRRRRARPASWRRPSASTRNGAVAARPRPRAAAATVSRGHPRHVDGQHDDQVGGAREQRVDARRAARRPGRRRRVLAGEGHRPRRSAPRSPTTTTSAASATRVEGVLEQGPAGELDRGLVGAVQPRGGAAGEDHARRTPASRESVHAASLAQPDRAAGRGTLGP